MRTREELEAIKSFVDNAYNNYGNQLRLRLDKPYNPRNPELGYSYKYSTFDKNSNKNIAVYNIVCAPTGIERTDFRILLHEYGHVYLAHLDGIYEEMDVNICNTFRDYRNDIIDRLNKSLNITWADKLIERVIDDKVLNHSIHNIAMDMEVNSKVLSTEDIDEMEKDISKTMVSDEENELKKILDNPETPESIKKKAQEALDKMMNEAKIKLICPCRYHTSDGNPFKDGLSYVEYLILIIKNLDQFVKMMINIQNGGNGDTSQVTDEQVQDALNGGAGSGNNPMQGLDELMQSMGMSDSQADKDGGAGEAKDILGAHDTSNSGGRKGNGELVDSPFTRSKDFNELLGGTHRDHGTQSRDDADKKRELGQIVAGGGLGCGSSGSPSATREVSKADTVDEAIDEVMLDFKSRIIKRELKKDSTWYWNRGINRSVLAPAYRNQVTVSHEPKIVYLIDISGSMDTCLIDRILGTIAKKMRHCGTGRGLKYDIITWSTRLGEHLKDIDPKKGVPRISSGGGTWMAGGMQLFRETYDDNAVLVLISDFCDDLDSWNEEAKKMKSKTIWGFNYGSRRYTQQTNFEKNFKVRNFNKSYDY
jgi:hypothetical protein